MNNHGIPEKYIPSVVKASSIQSEYIEIGVYVTLSLSINKFPKNNFFYEISIHIL